MAKEEKTNEVEKVNQQDVENLGQIFVMARIHTINTEPQNKKALVDLINFENQLIKKLNVDNSENTRN